MKKYETYHMRAENGASAQCRSHTLAGAKREASDWITFGGGSVVLVNYNTGETWTRKMWDSKKALNSFGWYNWQRVV